jgi:hypothetical protein
MGDCGKDEEESGWGKGGTTEHVRSPGAKIKKN